MINRLHALLRRPGKGWDPVPREHAIAYARAEWDNFNRAIVDEVETRVSGLAGKTVLDLGAGPGQFSVAFAQRGARVTWHDISAIYMSIAQQHCREAGVNIEFSLGYLEEARRFTSEPFDVVFCRIAWYYCMNDFAFARLVYSLVKPGGFAFIDANNSDWEKPRGFRKVVYFANNCFGWKIGHPHPPHGRVASLFQKLPLARINLDYTEPGNDRVFFQRPNEHGKRCL